MTEPTTLTTDATLTTEATPAEQISAITRRGNATLSNAREQWSGQAQELGIELRARVGHAWDNPEQVLDAVFDLVVRLIDQQRELTRGVLRATSLGAIPYPERSRLSR